MLLVLVVASLPSSFTVESATKTIDKVPSTDITSQQKLASRQDNGKMLIDYDAVIKDTVINGTVVIERESHVLFDNVTFIPLSGAYDVPYEYYNGLIEVYDDSEVIIRNSRIIYSNTWVSYMFLFNNSHMIFEHVNSTYGGQNIIVCRDNSQLTTRTSDIYIYADVFDNATATIESYYGYIIVHAFNDSSVLVSGNFSSFGEFYTFNTSSLMAFDSSFYSGAVLVAFDYSSMNLTNIESTHGGMIQSKDFSDMYIYDSNLGQVITTDCAYLYTYNTNISYLELQGSSIFDINGGTFYQISINMGHEYSKHDMYGPDGVLDGIIANDVWTISMHVITIKDSLIDSFYYSVIHNDTVDVTEYGISSTSSYNNYVSIGSSMNYTTMMGNILLVMNATMVTVNSTNISDIYAYNAYSMYIYNYGGGNIYLWHTSCVMNRTNNITTSLEMYDSSLDIYDSVFSSLFMDIMSSYLSYLNVSSDANFINAENTSFAIDRAIIQQLVGDLFSCSGFFNNTILVDAMLGMYYSKIRFDNVNYTGELNLDMTFLNCSNTYINETSLYDLVLEDGSFDMQNGMIIAAGSKILSGVYNTGNSSIEHLYVDAIKLYSAVLNMTDTIIENNTMNDDIWFDIINSTLYTENISFTNDMDAYLKVYNDSYIQVEKINGTIMINDSSGWIKESNITWLTSMNSTLTVLLSNVSNINAENSNITLDTTNVMDECNIISGELDIYYSEIQTIHDGDPFYFANGSCTRVDMDIQYSNISEMLTISVGDLYIKNSSIDFLLYFYHEVTLENTITGDETNPYGPFTFETATIDSSGSYYGINGCGFRVGIEVKTTQNLENYINFSPISLLP